MQLADSTARIAPHLLVAFSESPVDHFMSAAPPASPPEQDQIDPVFIHSRREAIIIFCVWLTGLIWAVPFCYFNGYVRELDPGTFKTIWGIPSWLFWGIFVPWIAADIFTTWFCFCYMEDDDLGAAAPEESSEGADS